ncbi:hypothetical protein FKM82_029932 [Ascaphus truei]
MSLSCRDPTCPGPVLPCSCSAIPLPLLLGSGAVPTPSGITSGLQKPPGVLIPTLSCAPWARQSPSILYWGPWYPGALPLPSQH